jgi:hypothetical protein
MDARCRLEERYAADLWKWDGCWVDRYEALVRCVDHHRGGRVRMAFGQGVCMFACLLACRCFLRCFFLFLGGFSWKVGR